jgi:hypothetical protein
MPYKLKKEGSDWYVINPDTGEKKNKKPMTRQKAVEYLQALYANVPDARG